MSEPVGGDAVTDDDFRNLADALPQLAWIARADGHIVWYNARWYDYTGTTLEEMHGWGWRNIHHPDHIAAVEVRYETEPQDLEKSDGEALLEAADTAERDGVQVSARGVLIDLASEQDAPIGELIGVAAALFPLAWLSLFTADAEVLATGTRYLRIVGPCYGFFGAGLALYFASQGAGRLFWPLLGGFIRLVIAVGGGWLAWRLTGSLGWVFAALALALVAYGVVVTSAVAAGAWFRKGERG